MPPKKSEQIKVTYEIKRRYCPYASASNILVKRLILNKLKIAEIIFERVYIILLLTMRPLDIYLN